MSVYVYEQKIVFPYDLEISALHCLAMSVWTPVRLVLKLNVRALYFQVCQFFRFGFI